MFVSAIPVKGTRSHLKIKHAALAACAALGLISVQASADIAGITQGGAGPTDYTLNGNAAAVTAGVPAINSPGVLTATSNVGNLATSAFYNTPQDVSNFTLSFLYDMGVSTANPADGIALVFQNDPRGTTALGSAGGALGYNGAGAITNSVAVGFDLWNGGAAANPTRTGPAFNGNGFAYVNTTPVNLRTNPVQVNVAYRDGIVTQTLTDTVTSAVSTQTFYATIPGYVGGSTALVGITGGTGGASAEQNISNFTYTVGNAPAPTPPAVDQLLTNVPQGGMGTFGVRESIPGTPVGNLDQAAAAVTSPGPNHWNYNAAHINILDTGNPGDFTKPLNPDNAYKLNGAGVGDPDEINNIAVVATGTIRIPTAGAYTFGVSSDDGFRLTIGGHRFENPTNGAVSAGGSLQFTGGRGADNVTLGTVFLPAGDHPIQLLNWEGGGGGSVELVAAPGIHNSMNIGVFNLVGGEAKSFPRRAGTISQEGFAVHNFNGLTDPDGAGPLTTLDAAISRYNSFKAGTGAHDGERLGDPTVFMSDPEGRGAQRSGQADFGADRPFPNNTAAAEDNFGTSATAELTITTEGIYTFDILADDLFRFRLTDSSGSDVDLFGMGGGVIGQNTDGDAANDAFRSTSCCGDRFGYYNLAAGTYDLEVIMQEGGGGASFSLFGAFGQFDQYDPAVFQLVGQNIDTMIDRPAGLQLVPEPGTFAMLGMAGLGILARRRRR